MKYEIKSSCRYNDLEGLCVFMQVQDTDTRSLHEVCYNAKLGRMYGTPIDASRSDEQELVSLAVEEAFK